MARQGGAPVTGYDPGRRRTTSEGSSPSVAGGKSQKSAFSDRYVLGEELGRGAFGQVSHAYKSRSVCRIYLIPKIHGVKLPTAVLDMILQPPGSYSPWCQRVQLPYCKEVMQ